MIASKGNKLVSRLTIFTKEMLELKLSREVYLVPSALEASVE